MTLDIAPTADDRLAEILSDDALAFVGDRTDVGVHGSPWWIGIG